MRVSIKSIQAFEAAARLGSFALAADELAVTPSAISHQVRLLEDQIGIMLFHRVHRSVMLTDVGRQYAAEVIPAFAQLDAATRLATSTGGTTTLTIHSTPSIATQWLMRRLSAYKEAHPEIDLRLAALPEDGVAMAVAQPPDLVLLDIQLPGIDGYEVLRRLRQHPPLAGTPVIAVSANALPSDVAQAHEAGFSPWQVRAVATQTLREARNRDAFLVRAEAALGHPVEVISGREEARLIYAGVSFLQPGPAERLVIDIGGRSTEMILGQGRQVRVAESFKVGSVSLSMRFFGDGRLTACKPISDDDTKPIAPPKSATSTAASAIDFLYSRRCNFDSQ